MADRPEELELAERLVASTDSNHSGGLRRFTFCGYQLEVGCIHEKGLVDISIPLRHFATNPLGFRPELLGSLVGLQEILLKSVKDPLVILVHRRPRQSCHEPSVPDP